MFFTPSVYTFFIVFTKICTNLILSLLAGEFPHPKMVYHASGDEGA